MNETSALNRAAQKAALASIRRRNKVERITIPLHKAGLATVTALGLSVGVVKGARRLFDPRGAFETRLKSAVDAGEAIVVNKVVKRVEAIDEKREFLEVAASGALFRTEDMGQENSINSEQEAVDKSPEGVYAYNVAVLGHLGLKRDPEVRKVLREIESAKKTEEAVGELVTLATEMKESIPEAPLVVANV